MQVHAIAIVVANDACCVQPSSEGARPTFSSEMHRSHLICLVYYERHHARAHESYNEQKDVRPTHEEETTL